MRVALFTAVLVFPLIAGVASSAGPEAQADPRPGFDGTWTWTRPEIVIGTPFTKLNPYAEKSTHAATLLVGPYNGAYLDWTVHLPDARVGCHRGQPTYGIIVDGEVRAQYELPGACSISLYSPDTIRVEWHASLAAFNGQFSARAGLMRGDGLF